MLNVPVSFAVEVKKDPQTIKANQIKSEGTKFDISDFEYKSDGRRDPFEPVLLLREQSRREVKVVKDKKSTGDGLSYELEELRLVGVLKSDKGMMAMMEDTQGKGIFFRKGDPLNQNMWVADISNTNVVFAYKLKGEMKKVVVELPIKK
jgi:Tfp pilus assembly protein PilP